MNPTVIIHDCLEDAPVTYLARVRDTAGTLLTEAAVTSIACKVYRISGDDAPELIDTLAPLASESVYDTLQTSEIPDVWDLDETGYNFKHVLPGSLFSSPLTSYRVEYRVTPVSGEAFPLRPLEVRTGEFYSS